MTALRRVSNLFRFGVGSRARQRKFAAKRAEKDRRLREQFWDGSDWERDDGLARRRYQSYDAYVRHQASKLDGIMEKLRAQEPEDLRAFERAFRDCPGLEGARNVLCLGARLGTEVRALHEMGFFAVGIDLNPGPENPYVLPGDFNALVFPDGSADAVYTNTLDHAFDLSMILAQVKRVLRPGGAFIVDFFEGYEEGFIAREFESTHWESGDSLLSAIGAQGGLTLESLRDLGQRRGMNWRQAVFRKAQEG